MINFEEHCKTLSDAALENYVYDPSSSHNRKIALEEIHRRKQAKEQQNQKQNKKIENYTVIILIATIIGVIIGAIMLFVSLGSSPH